MALDVEVQSLSGPFHRLVLRDGDRLIGEYERAKKSEIPRKLREIERASGLLLDLFDKYGRLEVRVNATTGQKVVKDTMGNQRGIIPPEFLRDAPIQTRAQTRAHSEAGADRVRVTHRANHAAPKQPPARRPRHVERELGSCPTCGMQLLPTGACGYCEE